MKLLRAKNNKSSNNQTVIIFRENFFIFFEGFFSISRQAYYGGFGHGSQSWEWIIFLLGVFTMSATMNQENKTQVSIVSQYPSGFPSHWSPSGKPSLQSFSPLCHVSRGKHVPSAFDFFLFPETRILTTLKNGSLNFHFH